MQKFVSRPTVTRSLYHNYVEVESSGVKLQYILCESISCLTIHIFKQNIFEISLLIKLLSL